MSSEIAIIMGSSSDLKVMNGAMDILNKFDVKYDVKIVSAHRTPAEMLEFASSAKENGYKAIIAGAAGAAHLPGMVASATILPVIGVPVNLTAMNGMDSLLSIAQMPKGVPVATMAIDNSTNAGLFAVRILAVENSSLQEKLGKYTEELKQKVKKMNDDL